MKFKSHLQWMTSGRGRGRALTLDDLIGHPVDGPDAVAVTFDDGFLNTRSAVETLLASGVPVTLFIVTGRVGGTNNWSTHGFADVPTLPLLGWDDIAHLAARGAAIAAHTRSHTDLTRITAERLDDELLGSRDDVKARIGVETRHVAYPYGEVDHTVARHAAQYFQWGHATDLRVMRGREDSLRLPRIDMYYFRSAGALESWGTAGFARRLAWYRARRAVRARLVASTSAGTTRQGPPGV